MTNQTLPQAPVPVLQTEVPKHSPSKLIVVSIATILFVLAIVPFPYYQSYEFTCKPGQKCPGVGWHFGPSFVQSIGRAIADAQPKRVEETSTSTPVPSVNPTVDWTSYTFKSLTFSYPQDWILDTSGLVTIRPPFLKTGEEFPAISFYTLDNPNNLSVKDYEDMTGRTGWRYHLYSSLKGDQKVLAEEKIVDNITGYLLKDDNCEPLGCDIFSFVYDKKIYVVSNVYDRQNSLQQLDSSEKETMRKTFSQILSTFKFLDVTPSPTSPAGKKITYQLPAGWTTVGDKNELGGFEIGYDPATTKPDPANSPTFFLSRLRNINDPNLGYMSFISVELVPYDGGSRHQLIYQHLGQTPTKQDLLPSYREAEYIYDGKLCLFLEGISISQYPIIWGMCDVGGGKALLITSASYDYEQTLRTIKLSL